MKCKGLLRVMEMKKEKQEARKMARKMKMNSLKELSALNAQTKTQKLYLYGITTDELENIEIPYNPIISKYYIIRTWGSEMLFRFPHSLFFSDIAFVENSNSLLRKKGLFWSVYDKDNQNFFEYDKIKLLIRDSKRQTRKLVNYVVLKIIKENNIIILGEV